MHRATAFRLNRETGQWHVIGAGPSVETQVGSCTTMGANGTQTVFFGCFDGVVQFVKLARQ